jgi:hypothetical protein
MSTPTTEETLAALGHEKMSFVHEMLSSPEEGVDVNPSFHTPLTPEQEPKFHEWVKQNKVPFDDSQESDYDMRGFWRALQEGDPDAKTAVSAFDGRLHFPDTYKTPYHRTFSNESIYAGPDAPHWDGDRLIDKSGKVIADKTPKKPNAK